MGAAHSREVYSQVLIIDKDGGEEIEIPCAPRAFCVGAAEMRKTWVEEGETVVIRDLPHIMEDMALLARDDFTVGIVNRDSELDNISAMMTLREAARVTDLFEYSELGKTEATLVIVPTTYAKRRPRAAD